MGDIRILDITDAATFGRVPPCADPGFDHRSCDYWEDDARGSKAARLSWLEPSSAPSGAEAPKPRPANPFLADLEAKAPAANPFATARPANPFLTPGELDDGPIDNPFAPAPVVRSTVGAEAPRKLQLLGAFGAAEEVLLEAGLLVRRQRALVIALDEAAFCNVVVVHACHPPAPRSIPLQSVIRKRIIAPSTAENPFPPVRSRNSSL